MFKSGEFDKNNDVMAVLWDIVMGTTLSRGLMVSFEFCTYFCHDFENNIRWVSYFTLFAV